jgi:hypothetical protein
VNGPAGSERHRPAASHSSPESGSVGRFDRPTEPRIASEALSFVLDRGFQLEGLVRHAAPADRPASNTVSHGARISR